MKRHEIYGDPTPGDTASLGTSWKQRPKPDLKTEFPARLNGNGKPQYKRYCCSPIRYADGKSLAVGYVTTFCRQVSSVLFPRSSAVPWKLPARMRWACVVTTSLMFS